MRLLKTLVVVVAAAAAVGSLPSAGAAARAHAPTAGVHVHIDGLGAPHSKVGSQSKLGAGWWFYPGTPNVSSASAQFTVPSFSCSGSHLAEGLFPGIWVYDADGTLTQQIDLNLYCTDGTAHMADVICILGSTADCSEGLSFNTGDKVVLTFSESAFHTQGQIWDRTTGAVDAIYDGTPAPTSDYSVFIGDAGPQQFGFGNHVPIFQHVLFKKVSIDGYYASEYSAEGATVLKTLTYVQIKTGALVGDGDSFNTTFAHI